jgi:histidine triad (HIT) family protein
MDCIFCKIVKGDIKSDRVYENADVFAFRDINPHAPVHILLIPRKHVEAVDGMDDRLMGKIFRAASEIAKKEKIDKSGYRVVVNYGPDAGQAVAHLHFHILGGRKLGWPPG